MWCAWAKVVPAGGKRPRIAQRGTPPVPSAAWQKKRRPRGARAAAAATAGGFAPVGTLALETKAQPAAGTAMFVLGTPRVAEAATFGWFHRRRRRGWHQDAGRHRGGGVPCSGCWRTQVLVRTTTRWMFNHRGILDPGGARRAHRRAHRVVACERQLRRRCSAGLYLASGQCRGQRCLVVHPAVEVRHRTGTYERAYG